MKNLPIVAAYVVVLLMGWVVINDLAAARNDLAARQNAEGSQQ